MQTRGASRGSERSLQQEMQGNYSTHGISWMLETVMLETWSCLCEDCWSTNWCGKMTKIWSKVPYFEAPNDWESHHLPPHVCCCVEGRSWTGQFIVQSFCLFVTWTGSISKGTVLSTWATPSHLSSTSSWLYGKVLVRKLLLHDKVVTRMHVLHSPQTHSVDCSTRLT